MFMTGQDFLTYLKLEIMNDKKTIIFITYANRKEIYGKILFADKFDLLLKIRGIMQTLIKSHSYYRQYVFSFRSSNLTFVSLISHSYLSYIFRRDRFQYFIFKRTVDYPTKRQYF